MLALTIQWRQVTSWAFTKLYRLLLYSQPVSLSTSPCFFSALSTNSNTLSCTKWMGLLCWSLFSSVESSSSLTSTTSMEGMSVLPSLYSFIPPSHWAFGRYNSWHHQMSILCITEGICSKILWFAWFGFQICIHSIPHGSPGCAVAL